MTRFNLDELNITRAGSDYLVLAWSMNVKGYPFEALGEYEFVRDNGTSFKGYPIRRDPDGSTVITDEDGLMLWEAGMF